MRERRELNEMGGEGEVEDRMFEAGGEYKSLEWVAESERGAVSSRRSLFALSSRILFKYR